MISKAKKSRIMAQIRSEMQLYYEHMPQEDRGPIGSYCMFWADLTVRVLKAHNYDAIIQAGTAYWPCGPVEADGGQDTYGFEFEWNKTTYNKIIQGGFPEIHVWAAIVSTPPSIIDPVSFNFKLHCLRNGRKWNAPDPPDYLWVEPGEWPKGVTYKADKQAIEYVHAVLHSVATGSPVAIKVLRKFDS